MNLKEKTYQMFILGTDGDGYIEALKNNLGGMIFFTHDITSHEQFKTLIRDAKSLAKTKPFLSIDQEGGRVERTENLYKGKKYLSAKYAFEKGDDFLRAQSEKIALELKDFGINLNFSPCIDVNTNPKNPVIGERAFSDNPDDVIKGYKIVSQVYSNQGIISCVKHFPGHGDASSDSHLTLPIINLTLDEMESIHIKPFAAAINDGIEMVMAAHLHCTCFEKDPIPASLSANTINYLRNTLKFNGVIISDDMIMKGVSDFGSAEACERSINAGVNMFIYRNSSPETINVIETLSHKASDDCVLRKNIEKSFELIQQLKSKI